VALLFDASVGAFFASPNQNQQIDGFVWDVPVQENCMAETLTHLIY